MLVKSSPTSVKHDHGSVPFVVSNHSPVLSTSMTNNRAGEKSNTRMSVPDYLSSCPVVSWIRVAQTSFM